MAGSAAIEAGRVRAAEIAGAMCLATDLGMGLPLEHGLQGTLFGIRLARAAGAGEEAAQQAYYLVHGLPQRLRVGAPRLGVRR